MKKRVLPLLISMMVLVTSFCVLNVAATNEDVDNVFVMGYDYNEGTINSVLTIDGSVCICGFDAELHYDKTKYAVESAKSLNPNVMVNVLSNKGEIAMSMASTSSNIEDVTEVVAIEFTCLDTPDENDFSLDVTYAYIIDENYDSVDVGFSIESVWEGLDNTITTTVSTTPIMTDDVLNTDEPDTNENEFVVSITKNSEELIELEVSVVGDVKFYSILGSIQIDSYGLGEPQLVANSSETMAVYDSKDSTINFSVLNSSGSDVTDETMLFKYTLPIEKTNYKISCHSDISSICDQNFDDVDYSVTVKNEVSEDDAQSTVTTITTTGTTTLTTTKATTTKASTTSATKKTTTKTTSATTTNTTTKTTTTETTTENTSSEITIGGQATEITEDKTTETTEAATTEVSSNITDTTTVITDSAETTASVTIKTESQTSVSDKVINASSYELSNWAANDYYKKTGIQPFRSSYVENEDGTLSITLYDKEENVLDIYKVHPKTGVGFDNNGNEVNLPRTGNNSLMPLFMIAFSMFLLFGGSYLIKKSGFIKNEK